jgi:hypothetical protein
MIGKQAANVVGPILALRCDGALPTHRGLTRPTENPAAAEMGSKSDGLGDL